MSKDKINYSQFWSKLNEFEHTTIRKHKQWNLHEIKPEFVKSKYLQDVLVFKRERKRLLDVEPELLMKDTDSNSVEDALDKINDIKISIDLRYGLLNDLPSRNIFAKYGVIMGFNAAVTV